MATDEEQKREARRQEIYEISKKAAKDALAEVEAERKAKSEAEEKERKKREEEDSILGF